jgi:peroxiredoxin
MEQAVQEIRDCNRDATLAERLGFISQKARSLSPSFADEADLFVWRLPETMCQTLAKNAGVHSIGRSVGKLSVCNLTGCICVSTGSLVCLLSIKCGGAFPNGCRDEATQIIAISAETQMFTRKLKFEAEANFPFLTYVDNGSVLSLNLAIYVDDAMSALIAGTGWNVPSYQSSNGWFLQIPSTYVVGQDGLVKMRHVDPDYRNRVDIDALRGTLSSLLGDLSLNARLPPEHEDSSSPCI